MIHYIFLPNLLIAYNQQTVNKSNWINHPIIKEIRQIYNAIELSIKNDKLNKQEKRVPYKAPYHPTLKKIYYDDSQKIKKYIEEAGSEDSHLQFNYYYDNNQRLRFVFITGGAINGASMEHRIYLTPKGEKIWEIQKYTQGPKYTFPTTWPQESLVFTPWKRFNTDNK